jgi:hypothetical protein
VCPLHADAASHDVGPEGNAAALRVMLRHDVDAAVLGFFIAPLLFVAVERSVARRRQRRTASAAPSHGRDATCPPKTSSCVMGRPQAAVRVFSIDRRHATAL